MKKIRYIAIIILIVLNNNTYAQTRINSSNFNTWFVYTGTHKVAQKWSLHLEAQIRRNDGISKWQQLFLRTGINYHINSNVSTTIGYAFAQTYPYGAFPVKVSFPEHRLWEQLQIKNQLGRFEWISRFRLEQRFSKLPALNTNSGVYEPGNAVYTNRFRLMNRFSVPFKGKIIADKSLYFSASDEVMINFGKNAGTNIFDQNRAYIAVGYKIPVVGRLEVGYMEQTLIKSDGLKIENNHTLQVALASNIDFMKKKKK